MVNCPNCDAVIDLDEEELDEGDTLTCEECGADLTITGLEPLEVETTEDEEMQTGDFQWSRRSIRTSSVCCKVANNWLGALFYEQLRE